MKTLLEQAKEYKPELPKLVEINAEEREVYIALLKGEIELRQARKVIITNLDNRFRVAMCELYKRGLLEVKTY